MAKKNLDEIKKKGDKLWEEVDRVMDLIGKTSSIQESSLSRVWKYTQGYDIAIISASRSVEKNCIKPGKEEGHEFTPEENNERTQNLKALLISRGYGITSVDGTYIENFQTPQAVEVREDSFLVVNWNHDKDFVDKIFKLGRFFCQDSVLIKLKDNEDAHLLGTNNAEFPGLGNIVTLGKFSGGKETEFSSKIGNRPFTFMEDLNPMTRGAVSRNAKKLLEQLGEDF